MAHLMTCTPAWRRVGVSHHNQLLAMHPSFGKKMKEKYGGQPNLPVEVIAMIERGEIAMDTDPTVRCRPCKGRVFLNNGRG